MFGTFLVEVVEENGEPCSIDLNGEHSITEINWMFLVFIEECIETLHRQDFDLYDLSVEGYLNLMYEGTHVFC